MLVVCSCRATLDTPFKYNEVGNSPPPPLALMTFKTLDLGSLLQTRKAISEIDGLLENAVGYLIYDGSPSRLSSRGLTSAFFQVRRGAS